MPKAVIKSCKSKDRQHNGEKVWWFIVLNLTFNNTSVISWRSVLLVDETVVSGEKHNLSQVTDQLYHIMLYLAKEKRQTMIYLTPNREQYIINANLTKTGSQFRCSGMISSSCSTYGTRSVTLVTSQFITIKKKWIQYKMA